MWGLSPRGFRAFGSLRLRTRRGARRGHAGMDGFRARCGRREVRPLRAQRLRRRRGQERREGGAGRHRGIPRMAQVARHAAYIRGTRREGGGHTASRQDDEPLRQHAWRIQASCRGRCRRNLSPLPVTINNQKGKCNISINVATVAGRRALPPRFSFRVSATPRE